MMFIVCNCREFIEVVDGAKIWQAQEPIEYAEVYEYFWNEFCGTQTWMGSYIVLLE